MELSRNILGRLRKDFGRKEASVLIGPRQVGKTTILKKIIKHCVSKKIPYEYFNLEVPAHAEHFARPMGAVLKN